MRNWILGISFIFLTLTAFATTFRDPTMPPDYSGDTPTYVEGQFQLQSILISSNRRIAVINNHFYTVGDVVEQQYKLIAINDDHIILLGPKGKQITLQILPEIVKKVSNSKSMNRAN